MPKGKLKTKYGGYKSRTIKQIKKHNPAYLHKKKK